MDAFANVIHALNRAQRFGVQLSRIARSFENAGDRLLVHEAPNGLTLTGADRTR